MLKLPIIYVVTSIKYICEGYTYINMVVHLECCFIINHLVFNTIILLLYCILVLVIVYVIMFKYIF